jgi:hypothetical protein
MVIFLLAEWLAAAPVHGSIGFPEIVVPIVVLLRKSLKGHAICQTAVLETARGRMQVLLGRSMVS